MKQEKFWTKKIPDDALDQIGTQKSLFCWVKNKWTNPGDPYSDAAGWLACDDGSMEIADFIHLDEASDPPCLSLIHVKGANSKSKNRRLSVGAYEVVTGQAVKNLRYLDSLKLAGGLKRGLEHKIGKLVWHNRQPTDRLQMIDRLARLREPYRRIVVVLQPHVRKSRLSAARANPGHTDRAILRQLDTLLWSAHASCNGLGGEFRVMADGS